VEKVVENCSANDASPRISRLIDTSAYSVGKFSTR
jgi:hypothetical protein